jgi:hypothetical protein
MLGATEAGSSLLLLPRKWGQANVAKVDLCFMLDGQSVAGHNKKI